MMKRMPKQAANLAFAEVATIPTQRLDAAASYFRPQVCLRLTSRETSLGSVSGVHHMAVTQGSAQIRSTCANSSTYLGEVL